jgi:hypothetical protein
LKPSLVKEILSPRIKGGAATIEDKVVSLFPNLPCPNDEELHEERIQKLLFGLNHHLEEASGEIPLNSKVLPASLTKRATEEEMKSSFFHIVVAKDTIVVVSFQLVPFPFENISCI